MKKIILLIFILLLTGCFDYIEINDLAFISAIAIDYNDDNYELTFEILSDKKQGEENSNNKAYTVSGKGKTLSLAIDDVSMAIGKKPYYHHLKAVIVDKQIAENRLDEIIDYLVRSADTRNEFYLVISPFNKANDIVKATSEMIPVTGDEIVTLIQTDYYNSNASYDMTFEDALEKFLNDKVDAVTTSITLEDNIIKIAGIAIFNNFNYIETLDSNYSSLFNLLNKNHDNYLLTNYYKDKSFTIKINSGKTEYDINNNKITINCDIQAEILENNTDLDIRDDSIYKQINDDFSKIMAKDINELIELIKKDNSDILGFNLKQYKKSKKDKKEYLQDAEVKINVDLKINRKGLIFEVENE